MNDDLISRAAAIDALAEQMPTPYTPDGSHPADEGIFAAQEVYADCIETIKLLPSAQPEIIRCKDCLWRIGRDCTRFTDLPVYMDDYCGRAKRRGEQDEEEESNNE